MHTTDAFRPSWIDQFAGWIDHLPGRGSLFYLVGVLVIAFFTNAVFWIDGSLPIWQIDPQVTASSLFVLYWIGLYQYLTKVAVRSLHTFRPLLDEGHFEFSRIQYRLTVLPRGFGFLALGLGVVFSAVTVLGEPQSYGEVTPRTGLVVWGDIAVTWFLSATFFCLIFRSIRQLRTVHRLHRHATTINLLHQKPAHAFSALTSRTAIGVVLVVIIGYFIDPFALDTALSILTYAVTVLLAVAVFAIPIMGIRDRLAEEKERVLTRISNLFQVAGDAMHGRIMDNDYSGMKEAEAAIAALIHERDVYTRVSTWPWDPGSLRALGSALLLPIVLWLITRLLERFLQ